tara:strand:- start:97 stop:714 length:618 start_codon:yes stop_codon:yes gene_type:complete
MIIIKYISFCKLYITRLWFYFSRYDGYLVLFFIIFLFFPINETYSTNLCDKFAALESDPNKISKPVLFENLNPKLVIKHCTTDIEKSRNSENISRFYLQRARGYLKNRSISDAISDLNKSYELGYPAAAFALATLFYLGDDVTQDFELAKKLYFESYNNGVIWAAKGLYFLYSNPNYIKNDKKLANMWKNLFIVQLNNNPSFSFD